MVSVIVPVYNVENVLHYCIESILDQTFRDFELILINDGSTDRSGVVCDRYAETDDRIRVIHKKNGGVSSARNAGIDAAEGEYICFVDSDDRLCEAFLSEMVNAMESELADIVVCGYSVTKFGKLVEERLFHEGGIEKVLRKNIYDLVCRTLYSAPWCKLFRSRIISNNKLRFPEDMSLGEDMLFNFMYTDCMDEICVLNKALYIYNTDNDNSLLRGYRRDLLEDVEKINRFCIHYLRKWKVGESVIDQIKIDCYYRYENVLYSTFSEENNDSFVKKIKFNNKVIRSSGFQTVYAGTPVKKTHKAAYSIKNYLPVYFYLKLRNLIIR